MSPVNDHRTDIAFRIVDNMEILHTVLCEKGYFGFKDEEVRERLLVACSIAMEKSLYHYGAKK
jgi:hypothetical protein